VSDCTVRDLYIYPLKSAAGLRLSEAELDAFGFAGDRRWMLVDDTGTFLTQRELPRMALLQVAAWRPHLVLRAPGAGELTVPTPDADAPGVDVPAVNVTVWDDGCEARDAGDEAARWATAFLSQPCRLVYAPLSFVRPVDPTYDRAYGTPEGAHVGFSDGFPLLLIGQGSLDALNARLAERDEAPVPMNRFRPNIVVDGAAPHDEDTWNRAIIGPPERTIRLDVVKPCARCSIVPVDQVTGIRGKEPLRTLATYRTRSGKVFFGQNVIHRNLGTIRVGDTVHVETRAG
jgi:uncharacterized protein YcbX